MCGDVKQLELGIQLTQFDSGKLAVVRDKENSNNFSVLYDGHKFRLFLKAFPGIVEKASFFTENSIWKLKIVVKAKCLEKCFGT